MSKNKTGNKKNLYFPSFFAPKFVETVYTIKLVCYNKKRYKFQL